MKLDIHPINLRNKKLTAKKNNINRKSIWFSEVQRLHQAIWVQFSFYAINNNCDEILQEMFEKKAISYEFRVRFVWNYIDIISWNSSHKYKFRNVCNMNNAQNLMISWNKTFLRPVMAFKFLFISLKVLFSLNPEFAELDTFYISEMHVLSALFVIGILDVNDNESITI